MIEPALLTPQQNGQYDRYPGPLSFVDNDVDRHLFFGREREIEHLLHRIRAVRLLVLFGKSGLGKTSLLQAGLYPLLRERGLLPVPVRLNQPDIEPVRAVLDAVWEVCRTHAIECRTGDTEGLWEFFKAADLWRGDVLQTPVLVFDQFEELFTLQPESVRTTVATQLGELSVRGLPTRIRHRVQAGEQMRYTDTPPDVKVILSLREEYVGALEDLVPNVPAVFEQRFRLAPLNTADARRAVVEPAALDKPHLFATRPFRYKKPTLDAMMKFLVNRQGEVEPFQLQIVCQHVEQQVAALQGRQDGEILVDDTVLGGRRAMETLLENFYYHSIRQLPTWGQRSRARTLCELGLLSPNGHRVSMEQGQIRKQYKVSDPSLQKLTETRLIRRETRPGLEGFYHELSHDSVAEAVTRSRRLRDPRLVKIIGFSVLFGMSCLVGGMTWLWQTGFTLDQAHMKVQSLFVSIHIEPEMQLISAGTFLQGNTHGGGDNDEQPLHEVEIKRFEIGKFEVTFDEYDRFALATGQSLPYDQKWGRERRPVINVSWMDAQNYANWLSQQTGKHYRLPTEAEWEYAARSIAMNKDEKWAGTSQEEHLDQYAVFQIDRTSLVGGKKPNTLSLYDMSGNVWEWVEDCRHVTYKGAPSDGSAWLEANGGDCGQRVYRGGSYDGRPRDLRTSDRNWSYAALQIGNVGFRLVRDLSS